MLRARGVYDGRRIVLDEPLDLPADTPVEILIATDDESDRRALMLQQMLDQGLISRLPESPSADIDDSFEPIEVGGPPVSQTIIDEREQDPIWTVDASYGAVPPLRLRLSAEEETEIAAAEHAQEAAREGL